MIPDHFTSLEAKSLMGCVSSNQKSQDTTTNTRPKHKRMFVKQRLIGAGGFGSVYAVTLQETNKWYAVKEVNKVELMKHKSAKEMIFTEQEAIARVGRHPFIVGIHMTFQDRLNCYFVMDLKNGGDLRFFSRKNHIFEERDVAFYVACISSALNHLHSRNIIHRDIKLENIILDERGWPHLADFGAAHLHTAANSAQFGGTLTSTLASGTKQYLAPEVFCKEHIHGPESDFWSLGIVAYELLYQKRPFSKHCNIEFIHFLEDGLTLKRKLTKLKSQQQQQQQQQQLQQYQAHSFPHHNRGLTVVTDGPEHTPFPLYNYSPQSQSQSPRTSYCASPRSSRDSSSNHNNNGGFFPGINASQSGSMDSTDGSGSNGGRTIHSTGYCSSVHATQASLLLSPGRLSHSYHAGSHSNATSRASTPNQFTDGEDHSDTERGSFDKYDKYDKYEKGDHRPQPLGQLHLPRSVPNSPARVSIIAAANTTGIIKRGIGFDSTSATFMKHTGHHLPNLDVSAGPGGASNKYAHQQNSARFATFLPPATSPVPVSSIMQQQLNFHGHFSASESRPLTTGTAQHSAPRLLAHTSLLTPARTPSRTPSRTTSPILEEVHEQDDDEEKTEETRGEAGEEEEALHAGTRRFKRACYGDHWEVDTSFQLPANLCVKIPLKNVFLGGVTDECVSFLKGILEIRPAHRLGSRDIDAVRMHPWMRSHRLENWPELEKHKYLPNFRPGKEFMTKIFEDSATVIGVESQLLDPHSAASWDEENSDRHRDSDSSRDSGRSSGSGSGRGSFDNYPCEVEAPPEMLSAEQQATFRGFSYTSEPFQALFAPPNKPVTAATATGAATGDKSLIAGKMARAAHRVAAAAVTATSSSTASSAGYGNGYGNTCGYGYGEGKYMGV